jgi:gliding motility-associated protein GldM
MAGGKLTPRQKMINLMYLVFIAMLAMNMSKEVLSAFGLMNEKFESANTASMLTSKQMLESLDKKAAEAKGDFVAAAATSHKVEAITKGFYDYIGTLKATVLTGVENDKETGKLPYEAMDKGDNIDNSWFTGEGYSLKGNEIIKTIEKYKSDMKAALADPKFASVNAELASKFNLADVPNKEGIKIKYLEYHFDKFPAVASLAKLSAWQNDVKKAESDVMSAALGKAAVSEASYSKFQAIVVLDKNAYFQGETVTGKVVLGKYDPNAQFSGFKGPGKLVNGQAVLSMTAGGVGEQNIGGSFNFMENGKPINLPFKGTYVVVPKPNSATISADKMNVVYRGVVNPISVSFAGIGEDKVSASAAGLSPAGGKGKYNMSPGQGNEVTIVCTGKLPNGQTVSDKKSFRIKGIPAPAGTVRGEDGVVKGPKSSLAISTVGAKMIDFDFEVGLNVVGFNFKVAGQGTVVVQGNKITPQCVAAMSKAGRGDQVTISEIKTKLVGSTLMLQKTSPVIYEITQ